MSNGRCLIALAASDTLGLQGRLSPHFGRCHSWVLVEAEGDEPRSVRILANPFAASHDCQQLAGLLAEMKVTDVVAGGLGHKALVALHEKGIRAVTGFSGRIDQCLESYFRGERPASKLCTGHAHSH